MKEQVKLKKRDKLKNDVMHEVIKSRYGLDMKELDLATRLDTLDRYYDDNDKRYAKYDSRRI